MTAGTSAKTHWPGLDGLRGIAALSVVLFHLDLGIGVNGYAGVDVFFALSGFLITSLLLAEHARNGGVSLRRFYVRRMLRLYPAIVALCVAVVLMAVVRDALPEVLPAASAALLYFANWWIFTGHDAPMLDHTWTLAIEEHFYLVWPMLVTALLARARLVRAVGVIVAGGLAIALLVPWSAGIEPVRHSYLAGAPIVWGSALAVAARRGWLDRAATLLAPVGGAALLVLLGLLVIPLAVPHEWMSELRSAPGYLAVVVIAAVVAVPRRVRWLEWGPLVWAGRRSYGLYLWHVPVLSVLLRQIHDGPFALRLVVGLLLTLLVTVISYRFIEMPFLRLKDRIA